MGVLDSSYIKTVGVKSPGRKIIFCFLSDTLAEVAEEVCFFGSNQKMKSIATCPPVLSEHQFASSRLK